MKKIIMGVGVLSRHKAKQAKKLMSLLYSSFSLHQLQYHHHHHHHLCTLASARPPSSTTHHHYRILNVRPFVRMSSNVSGIATDAELDSIFKQKRLIRSKVRKSLKDMDPSQRTLEDDSIQQLVLDAPWFKSSARLCAYISCRALREVDTSGLLAEILQTSGQAEHKLEGKAVYVPRVEDKNSHMRMLKISSVDDLIANSMDILEPGPVDGRGNLREDVMLASEAVDLFILPGLAFDKSGRRLGRGGGYYDTFLRNYQQLASKQNWKQPLLVALAYSVQILDDEVIPITPNDVYVDALVSPAGVIPISSATRQRMEHGI